MKYLFSPLAFLSTIMTSMSASAAEAVESIAHPWQLGMQDPASPVMAKLTSMHDFLLWLIIGISLFVLVLLTYICIKFSRKNNPVPSRTVHNTQLEIIWTVIPIIILVVIAIPSLRLHYFMQKTTEAEMTLKVVGYQWYWHYEYPDQGGFGYDSYLVKDADLKPGDHRLLAVDNRVVVPVDTNVRVLLTGADVIHAWALPAFGVKRDAVPGRLNESWFRATKTGTFFGQCSELCGVGHGFMPIVVDVVSKEDFAAWVKTKQTEAGLPTESPQKEDAADKAQGQKMTTPLTKPVSAEHEDPKPVMDKEKKKSKPTASDNRPTSKDKDENQPAPAEAAGEEPSDNE